MRNVFNHACISSDVFAHRAIATGRGGGQAPIAIDQIDRQAINLELSEISLCWGSFEPILHLASAKDIVQAHHALKVLNIFAAARSGAYLLGGRIRHGKLWMFFFECKKALEEGIKVGVGNSRLTVVVQVAVAAHFLRKVIPFTVQINWISHAAQV